MMGTLDTFPLKWEERQRHLWALSWFSICVNNAIAHNIRIGDIPPEKNTYIYDIKIMYYVLYKVL